MLPVQEFGLTFQKISLSEMNVEEELTSILSQEIAKSIDVEIMKGLGIFSQKNEDRKRKIKEVLDYEFN